MTSHRPTRIRLPFAPLLSAGLVSAALVGLAAPRALAAEVSKVLHKLGAGDGNLGWAVDGIGDFGPAPDGVPDVIVGAPSRGGLHPEHPPEEQVYYGGTAEIYSGATGELLKILYGEATVGNFGGAVADAGDVNGDGTSDIAVGAYGSSRTIDPPGYVKVFSGRDGAELHRLGGALSATRYGREVMSPGDLNGDGLTDLAIGAPGVTGAFPGYVEARSGVSGALLWTLQGYDLGLGQANLGDSIAALPDVDGDGAAELLIGAPRAAYGSSYHVGAVILASGASGRVLKMIRAKEQGDNFGYAVAAAGGFAAITTLGWGPENAALGQVQFLPAALKGRPALASGLLERRDVNGTPTPYNDFYGIGLDMVERPGGGALAIIGANGGYGASVAVGRVEILALGGRSPARVFTTVGLEGVEKTDRSVIGDGVASPGDLDGDAMPDLLFGDWGAGHAYVVAVAPASGGSVQPAPPLKLAGTLVRPQDELARAAAGSFKLKVKGQTQSLTASMKGLPADSATFSVHVETAPGSGDFAPAGVVVVKNPAKGQGTYALGGEGLPAELGIASLADLQGRRIEVRDDDGAVVLWTVVPDSSLAALKLKTKLSLVPAAGSPDPDAAGTLSLKLTGKNGVGTFDLRLAGVDRLAAYELWLESAPGSGDLVLAGQIVGGRLRLSTKKGQPLPLEAYDPRVLSGRRIEVRQGAAVILEGVMP